MSSSVVRRHSGANCDAIKKVMGSGQKRRDCTISSPFLTGDFRLQRKLSGILTIARCHGDFLATSKAVARGAVMHQPTICLCLSQVHANHLGPSVPWTHDDELCSAARRPAVTVHDCPAGRRARHVIISLRNSTLHLDSLSSACSPS